MYILTQSAVCKWSGARTFTFSSKCAGVYLHSRCISPLYSSAYKCPLTIIHYSLCQSLSLSLIFHAHHDNSFVSKLLVGWCLFMSQLIIILLIMSLCLIGAIGVAWGCWTTLAKQLVQVYVHICIVYITVYLWKELAWVSRVWKRSQTYIGTHILCTHCTHEHIYIYLYICMYRCARALMYLYLVWIKIKCYYMAYLMIR